MMYLPKRKKMKIIWKERTKNFFIFLFWKGVGGRDANSNEPLKHYNYSIYTILQFLIKSYRNINSY